MNELYQEVVTLPSLGLPYGETLPGGQVTLEPFGVREEQLLQKPGSAARRQLISTLLKCCVKDCPVDVDDFLIGDRLFLFMQIRRISLSDQWTFDWVCEHCEERVRDQLLISEATLCGPIAERGEEDEEVEWVGEHEILLPLRKKTVHWRHLTGRDEKAAINSAEQLRKKGLKPREGDPGYIYRMASALTRLDGEAVGFIDAQNFVANLKARDSLALRTSMEIHQIGYDFSSEKECPSCGWMNDVTMNFELEEFFRPKQP